MVSKVHIIGYADNLAIIHGDPIEDDISYKQMTTSLKMLETKAMLLGLKLSTTRCDTICYRSNDLDWNFKIAVEEIPW